jgi:ssDNA-binding Zn-finger/Zn-ribbon topoisomerase 1
MQERPLCPECGRPMYVYKKENDALRFRCSGYPVCKSYKKLEKKKEVRNELLHA